MTAILAEQVSEAKLQELLRYRFEADDLDFKETIDLRSKKDCVELCKDIIAMANTKGGHIVFGVRDEDFFPVGLPLDANLDPANIANTLDKYIDEKIDWLVAEYINEFSKRKFGILYVVPSRIPIVASKTGAYQEGDRQKIVFRETEFYVRDSSRSKPAAAKEIRAIIESRQASSAPLSPVAPISSQSYEPPVIHNLPRPNYLTFLGRDNEVKQILEALEHPRAWLVAIEGVGGVGKTALAQKIASKIATDGNSHWKFIIWMSAKETVLFPDKLQRVEPNLTNLDDLLNAILQVTDVVPNVHLLNHQEKLAEAKIILREFPCLLLVDNLETLNDEAVTQFVISDLPAPSKAIITSRTRTSNMGGLRVALKGLEKDESLSLLKEAAHFQGSPVILAAPEEKLEEIVKLTGGIPLALRLVVGQTALGTSLQTAIERLSHSDGNSILDFCFKETYRDLPSESQKLLGALSLFEEPASLEEAAMVAKLSYGQANQSIEQLSRLSLVEENYEDVREIQVYSLLPLTRIFARQRAKKFQQFYDEAEKRLTLFRLLREEHRSNRDVINKDSLLAAMAVTELEQIAVGLTDKAEKYIQEGNYSEALKHFQDAEILAPRLAYIQQAWAYMERRRNQLREARTHYQRAVELAPSNAEYYRYWASLEAKVGQHEEAIKLYKRANLLAPKDHLTKQGLATSLLKLSKQSRYRRQVGWDIVRTQLLNALDVVNELFDQHAEWATYNSYTWYVKAEILYQLKRPRQALETCNLAISIGQGARLEHLVPMLEKELK